MSSPIPPSYQHPKFTVPPVPAEYVEREFVLQKRRAWLFAALATVLVAVVLWSISMWLINIKTQIVHIGSPHYVIGTRLRPQLQITCPDQKPLDPSAPPSLDFCSPKYLGNVAGPVGSRIVLVGENFLNPPNKWLLVKSKVSTADQQRCLSAKLAGCLFLSPPEVTKNIQPSVFLFSWAWHFPFPNQKGDYYLVALLENATSVRSSLAFTVLSSQPPCITITTASSDQPSQPGSNKDCSHPQTITLRQSSRFTVQGTNWILGWNPQTPYQLNQQVEVIAQCAFGSQCSQSLLFDFTIVTDHSGAFTKQLPVPADATGVYTVSAANRTQASFQTGGPQNTIADHALTFGEDIAELTLRIA